jgi:hypothetical protein
MALAVPTHWEKITRSRGVMSHKARLFDAILTAKGIAGAGRGIPGARGGAVRASKRSGVGSGVGSGASSQHQVIIHGAGRGISEAWSEAV